MQKVDPRDFIQFSTTQCLNIVYDEFEQIKSTYIRDAYGKLQDIVQDNIRTQANFMIGFIENNIEERLKSILRKSYDSIEEELVSAANIACGQLEDVENLEEVNNITSRYLGIVLDKSTYKVNLDELAYEYAEELKRNLYTKFDSVLSPQIEDVIGEIIIASKRYVELMVENIYTEVDHLVTRINVRQKDAVNHYVAEYKKSLFNIKDNKYTEGKEEFTFDYNGKHIVYKYEGKNLNCYVNNEKIVNPSEIIEINRQLQDAFPQAQQVTDSMMKSISDMIVDNKQREKDVLGMNDSVNRVIIPDWAITAAAGVTPDVKEEELEDVTLDDYIKVEETKKAPKQLLTDLEINELLDTKEEIINPNASLDPEDSKITEEELRALLGALDIQEEKIEEEHKSSGPTPQELVQMLTIEDEPVRERTPEEKAEIQRMTAALEITDDEPEMVKPRDKFPNMGELQVRLDQLLKTPEVIEYLEIQDQITAYQEYVDQYGEKLEEEKSAALPDAILR